VGTATEMARRDCWNVVRSAQRGRPQLLERVFFTLAKFFVSCVPTAVTASIKSRYLRANREPRLWVLVPSCMTSNVRMTGLSFDEWLEHAFVAYLRRIKGR
jgi:hypothetical protein